MDLGYIIRQVGDDGALQQAERAGAVILHQQGIERGKLLAQRLAEAVRHEPGHLLQRALQIALNMRGRGKVVVFFQKLQNIGLEAGGGILLEGFAQGVEKRPVKARRTGQLSLQKIEQCFVIH